MTVSREPFVNDKEIKLTEIIFLLGVITVLHSSSPVHCKIEILVIV